jgi:RNA-dependent RNA polymerase
MRDIEKIKCEIVKESELREYYTFGKSMEIDYYFNKENSGFYAMGFDKNTLPVFMYLSLVIVSECIIDYFNYMEFLIRFNESKFIIPNLNVSFFNEALTNIINIYKNNENGFTLPEFEELLLSHYESVVNEQDNDLIKKVKHRHLIQSQRIIVTPTFTRFVPYIQDQGNRILRDYLSDPNDGIRLVFKMDNYEEARWNNPYLCEYIKYYLDTGLNIAGKSFRFFCYSQSQFRSMSCWLVVNPEEILSKSGKFHEINTVAKYGARIGQTLTTTIKTIQISEKNIIEIPDIECIRYTQCMEDGIYTYSDGVGRISYDLAERIAETLGLKEVPSAYQARFLGCKGVWTVMFNDFSGCIWVRPSQMKFRTVLSDDQYFEVCNYSKYIKSYLNRQVILLLSALGIKNEIFVQKLMDYKVNLEDEKFILSLINYEEWSRTFMNMHLAGVNRFNDRLIRSIVSSNREILYRELKSKARIFIDKGVNVMGVMDEFGILEYGEAYLHIHDPDGKVDLVLDKPCVVVKCPCLHPGDVRLLNFRQIEEFKQYKNVVIFPQKGTRPHPNEISGGDLDGDLYYVFYDEDLCKIDTVPPMDYYDNSMKVKKDNITLQDVIDFFAVYVNNNNLGLIADAHLAHADLKTASDSVAINLALKFSKAVDAPKTGEDVRLDDQENPDKYPHYMGKTANKSYQSNHILGKLYDMTLDYIKELEKKSNEKMNKYFDDDLVLPGYEKYIFEALYYYSKYYKDILYIIKTNEIQNESELLTGNNVDESSTFGKRKHNYDVIERIAVFMTEKFKEFSDYFENSNLNLSNSKMDIFTTSKNKRASAFYYVSYNILDIINTFKENTEILGQFRTDFEELLEDHYKIDYCDFGETFVNNYGLDYADVLQAEGFYIDYRLEEIKCIQKDLTKIENRICDFLKKEMKHFKIMPLNDPNEENQYKILSFPWCSCGNILTEIKRLK